jgi:hypothetical protein
METIRVQYTDPNNGLDRIETFRFDLVKYRKDDSSLPFENFFFTSTALTAVTLTEVAELIEATITANPFNPYACISPDMYGVSSSAIYGLVSAVPSSNSIGITKNPITLGFVANEPVAVLRYFDDPAPLAYLIPTDVTSSALAFASEDNVSTLGIKENFVVVKMQLPKVFAPSFTIDNVDWGTKAKLEKPGTPVLDAFLDSNTIKVTITPPATSAYVIQKYNVYVVKPASETFNILEPIIRGNRKPDLILSPGDTTNKLVSTWGGGTNAGGGTITAGNYYIVVVAKDGDDTRNVNCSYLSNIEYLTVT